MTVAEGTAARWHRWGLPSVPMGNWSLFTGVRGLSDKAAASPARRPGGSRGLGCLDDELLPQGHSSGWASLPGSARERTAGRGEAKGPCKQRGWERSLTVALIVTMTDSITMAQIPKVFDVGTDRYPVGTLRPWDAVVLNGVVRPAEPGPKPGPGCSGPLHP